MSRISMALSFGILLAMALFSYLMSSRSCQAIHALPIRREGLLLTNYVSALGFIAVPSLVPVKDPDGPEPGHVLPEEGGIEPAVLFTK
mgnify:CR=1 FL=1